MGRVVAVADVFDALTHDRPYKPAWPVGQAIARIQHAAGSQFDPRVVAAFLKLHMTPWLWARATALKTRCTQSAPRGSVGAPPPPGQRHVPPATPDALVDAAWREVHKRWRPNTYESLCKVPSQ